MAISNLLSPAPVSTPTGKFGIKPAPQSKVSGVLKGPYDTAPVTSAPVTPPKPVSVPSTPPVPTGLATPNQGTFNTPPPVQPTGLSGSSTTQNIKGLFPDVLSSLAFRQSQPSPQYTEAYNTAQDYNKKLQESMTNQAEALKVNSLNPIPIGDQEGRARVIQDQYLRQQQALGAGFQGASNLISGANTQQGLQTTALGTAAGYAQPNLSAFGQGYYNPLDPTGGAASAGGGALNPINNIQSLAQAVLSLQISPQQALQMGGNVPNFQGALTAAILQANPNANLAQLQGQFDASQQNTTTAGTAPTNAFAGAYQQNYPAYLQTQAQLSNVEGLGNLLLSTTAGGQINPFDPALANTTLAALKRNLSDADQQRFDSTLAAFSGAASQLLSTGSGQIPTDVSANIAKIANGSISLGALKAMVDQAKREGAIKLSTAASLVNTPGAGVGAPQVSSGSSTGVNLDALRAKYGY